MAPVPSGEAGPASHNPKENKQKCCLGALYFSESLNNTGKHPVCAGVPQTIKSAHDLSTLQSETVPPGHFRYLCLGYSMYNETRLRERQRGAVGAAGSSSGGTGSSGDNASGDRRQQQQQQGDDVELPYCEGVEIISAAALQRKPVLLEEGASPSELGTNPISANNQGPAPAQPKDRRNFVSPPMNGIRLDEFPQRFMKSSRKILDQMSINASRIVVTVKRTADRVQEGLWGDRSRDA